ncbi:MAG: D-alanyl-D-alanine carboxypeptidase, partial [Paracoccaceae bacterium]|nr:D-alanyl-D-alanine carboxypeptidase [Paracoccaceae bacterium]
MSAGRGSEISRRSVLAGLASVAGQAAFAKAPEFSPLPETRPPGLEARARFQIGRAASEELVQAASLKGDVAFVVADAGTGEILESRKPVLGLPPASVTKAITAQYALDTLGPAHGFATRLLATGPVIGGRLDGDLILMGGGDPELDTKDLAEMAAQVLDAGLREV